MIPLKYNTASQEIPLGRFVDSTDGDTEETALTINNTDIKLWKSGATTLANKNSGGATHISNGEYYCTLDATDTNTYGPMKVAVHVSGALPVQVWCLVMEANAHDALFAATGTGYIESNAVRAGGQVITAAAGITVNAEIGASATAMNNLEDFFDGTGYAGTNNVIPTVTTVTQDLSKYSGPGGLGVYFDSAAANTNTTLYTDGTYSNPVSTIAAALTLVTSLGAKRIYIIGGSTLVLTGQTLTDYEFIGIGLLTTNILNLGTAASPSILTGCTFRHLYIYGTHDLSDRIEIWDSAIDDAPAAEITKIRCWAIGCALVGDFSLDTSDDNVFDQCISGVAGNGYPVCNATGSAGTVVFRHYSGGIGFNSLSASHKVSVETDGQIVFESGCNVNAAVTIRGLCSKVDNTAGMSNLTETARIDTLQINAEADTALTDYDPPTNTEMTAAFTQIKGATWATTDTLEAIRDRGDAAWTTGSTHSAADVWAAATRTLTANTNLNDPTAAAIATAVLTTAMTEAYAALGIAPTLAQLLFEVRALLAEKGIASTTLTTKKLDGSTTAATYTLDDATTPTSITRAT